MGEKYSFLQGTLGLSLAYFRGMAPRPLISSCRLLVLGWVFLFILQGCNLPGSGDSRIRQNSIDQGTDYTPIDDSTGPAPEPPIASDEPAPPLEGDLLFAQAISEDGSTLVVGEAGFTSANVTEICIKNVTDDSDAICFPTKETEEGLVFQGIIEGAQPGDVLAIWGENPDLFISGGVGINDVEETVLAWWRKYPISVRDMAMTSHGLFLAGNDGLYLIQSVDLGKSSDEMPSPIKFTNGLDEFELRTVFEDSQGRVWVGSWTGLALMTSLDLDRHSATFENFTDQNGLGDKLINVIKEDSTGRLWIGTRGGLSLLRDLDSSDTSTIFENFGMMTYGGRFESGLPHIDILDLEEDSRGGIWVATLNGLAYLETFLPESDTVFFRKFGVESGLNFSITYELKATADGGLWIRGRNDLAYLVSFNETISSAQFLTFTVENGLPDTKITNLLLTPLGDLWASSWSGLLKLESLDALIGEISFQNYSAPTPMGSLGLDENGKIWFSTDSIHRVDEASVTTGELTLTKLESNEGLPNNGISDFLEDAEGNLWIGTSSGLGVLPFEGEVGDRLNLIQILEEDGLLSPKIRDLALGPDGHVWIGTGDGLMRIRNFDPFAKTYDLEEIPIDRSLITIPPRSVFGDRIEITKIQVDSLGDVWLGTLYGVLYMSGFDENTLQADYLLLDIENGLSANSVYDLALSLSGDVWILNYYGIQRVSFDQLPLSAPVQFESYIGGSELESRPRRICFDTYGRMWLSTYTGLFFTESAPLDEPLALQKVQDPEDPLEDIIVLEAGVGGSVLIGKRTGLMMIEDVDSQTLVPRKQVYTEEAGLPNPDVRAILSRGSSLWVGTINGLARFIP